MFTNADGFAIAIVWMFFAIYFVYVLILNFWIFPEKAKLVYCKDCEPSNPSTIKYKYLISIFLDDWSANYDIKTANVYLELITKTQTKMVSLTIKPEDIINKRAYLLVHRKKFLRPLTAIRAIHDCGRHNARIHLLGIKVKDLKFGEILYFAIDRNIYYQSMNSAAVHKTIKPDLRFFSEQVFGPNFCHLRTDTYSTKIISSPETNYETYGMVLRAEMDWFEETLFVFYLFVSIFYFNAFFAICSKRIFILSTTEIICLSLFLSSGIAYNSTNILAFFYRKYIKTNYNKNCSLILKEMDKDSISWTLYKNLSLSYIVIISLLISVFMPFFIPKYVATKQQYLSEFLEINILEDQYFNEILFLQLFFWANFAVCITFWLMFWGCLKYIYLSMFSTPKEIPFESLIQHTQTIDDTLHSLAQGMPSRVRPIVTAFLSSLLESTKPPLHLGTDKLQDELYSDQKNLRMITGSIIVKPNQSPGFSNPEKYRLGSDSKILSMPSNTNKK